MTKPTSTNPRPSPWAVALFVFSSGFALMSIWFLATGYSPI